MRKSTQFIVFLKNFTTGVMAPVLSLVLLAHGATIGTISLAIGAYSLTVILAEFPSGVFADLCGRKTAFLLSAVLFFISYCLLLLSNSVALLFSATVVHGLARAFSSGSIDALAVDQAKEHQAALEWVTARLAVLESAGLAVGALAGGLLASGCGYFVGTYGKFQNMWLLAGALLITLSALWGLLQCRKSRPDTPGPQDRPIDQL